jgi:hypothetical protein
MGAQIYEKLFLDLLVPNFFFFLSNLVPKIDEIEMNLILQNPNPTHINKKKFLNYVEKLTHTFVSPSFSRLHYYRKILEKTSLS